MNYTKSGDVKLWDCRKFRAEELTADQLDSIRLINSHLVSIEQTLKTEFERLNEIGNNRINDPDDWVEDFELEVVVTFCLSETDPAYDEDSDNILVELSEYGKYLNGMKDETLIGDGNNWNEYRFDKNHPLSNEHHCYLFHRLCDERDFGWINILRIGHIWLDVKFEFQKSIT